MPHTEDSADKDEAEPPITPENRAAAEALTRRLMRAASVAALVIGLAGAGVLYVMMKGGGKDGTVAAAACPGAAAALTRIAPLARGDVAAMAVASRARPAPDVHFLAPDGSARSLTDFRGRTVLLNLWATWCVPCRQEMPALDRLQAKMAGRPFDVVAVNIDTARIERTDAFLESIGVKHLVRYGDHTAEIFQTLKSAGKVVGLPTTLLIGPDGCELGVMAGPAEWDSEDAVKLVTAAGF